MIQLRRYTCIGIFCLSIAVSFIGCSSYTSGRNFVRPDFDSFKLGATTRGDVITSMGSPEVNIKSSHIKGMRIVCYHYANAMPGSSVDPKVMPAKSLTFAFYHDTLFSASFISSFKADNTRFDDSMVSNIVIGQSTRTDVIKLLGNPTSYTAMPSPIIQPPAIASLGYNFVTYNWVPGGLVFQANVKHLNIFFNDKDVVTDIDHTNNATYYDSVDCKIRDIWSVFNADLDYINVKHQLSRKFVWNKNIYPPTVGTAPTQEATTQTGLDIAANALNNMQNILNNNNQSQSPSGDGQNTSQSANSNAFLKQQEAQSQKFVQEEKAHQKSMYEMYLRQANKEKTDMDYYKGQCENRARDCDKYNDALRRYNDAMEKADIWKSK